MTDQKPPELIPERPAHMEFVHAEFARSQSSRAMTYRLRRVITCAVLLAAIGGGAYEMYVYTHKPTEIPTIKAELPLKQKPEAPGGIDIPNQDVLAYQQIDNSGNAQQPQPEHLLPPPETPKPSAPATADAQPAATPNAAAPAAPPVENLSVPPPPPPIETTVTPEKPSPVQEASVAPAPAAAPTPVVEKVDTNTPETPAASPPPDVKPTDAPASPAPPIAATPETPAAPVTPPPSLVAPAGQAAIPPAAEKPAPAAKAGQAAVTEKPGKKGFRVQLASYPDKDLASHEMGHMQKKFARELGPARLHLATADLGARGIFYRVQSSPITQAKARDICAELKKAKAGCIIVKP